MKTNIIQITSEDMREGFESKGLTIHGKPLIISERFLYERKEMDGGYLIFHYYEPFAHFHTTYKGRRCYICHPKKRNLLESEERKN